VTHRNIIASQDGAVTGLRRAVGKAHTRKRYDVHSQYQWRRDDRAKMY